MYTTYTTYEHDRWDLIAYKVYGDISLMGLLIEANSHLPLYDTFPANVVLNVPVIEPTDALIDVTKLPPWKR